MIDVTRIKRTALVDELVDKYRRTYGSQEPAVPEIVAWATELSLESIARSDALYHDCDHTMMVTLCGAEILRCRHLVEGGVTPRGWLQSILSMLFHDIGYVRGVCRDDRSGAWSTGTGTSIELPAGATDAALQPWHVDRGIRFVRERFEGHDVIDVETLARNIDYTRFPVPDDGAYHETRSDRAIVRAADLIGQLADPYYLRKLPALFHEMEETGMHVKLGFSHPSELRSGFPDFFARSVAPWVTDTTRWLRVTADGRAWIARLHDHVVRAGTAAPDAPS